MPGFDGNGVYDLRYSFVIDAANNIKILASRQDQMWEDVKTGFQTCMTVNGQTTVTANIPMSTFKFTGLGDGSAATDSCALGQLQKGTGVYVVTTGSSNAYVAAPSPAITSYSAGQTFTIKANFSNTGAATIAVNGLAAKALQKEGSALASGDIVSGGIYSITYDGTQFQVSSLSVPTTFEKNTTFSGTLQGGHVTYNTQTGTTYTLTASDNGKIVTLDNASAITLTLPEDGTETLESGFNCIIRQLGAGQVTVAVEGTDTLESKGSATKLVGQYSEAVIDLQDASDPHTWFMAGDITT